MQHWPTFMIVGAMKAGTSSLHFMLGEHPQIFMTRQKEMHAWDKPNPPDLDEYHSHFAAGANVKARGEATPSYAYVPFAIRRIAEYNPALRVIFIMRDPVERAISHLKQVARFRRQQSHPFDISAELKSELKGPNKLGLAGGQKSYRARGRYHEQVKRLFELFPKEQVLLLRLEDLVANSENVTRGICEFLDVEPMALPLGNPRKAKNSMRVPPEIRLDLENYYRPYNNALHRDFGIQISDWQ